MLCRRGLVEMKEPAPASGEVVLSSRKRLKPPSSNNGQPSRRPSREDEVAGREGVSMPRLLRTANVNHKSECYEDFEELEYPAALYSTMEQHLPPNFLNASREKKLALLDRILSKYRPNGERAKVGFD